MANASINAVMAKKILIWIELLLMLKMHIAKLGDRSRNTVKKHHGLGSKHMKTHNVNKDATESMVKKYGHKLLNGGNSTRVGIASITLDVQGGGATVSGTQSTATQGLKLHDTMESAEKAQRKGWPGLVVCLSIAMTTDDSGHKYVCSGTDAEVGYQRHPLRDGEESP